MTFAFPVCTLSIDLTTNLKKSSREKMNFTGAYTHAAHQPDNIQYVCENGDNVYVSEGKHTVRKLEAL